MNDDHYQFDNIGTEGDDYPEEWWRWDDLAVGAICVIAIVSIFLGVI